MDRIYTIAIVTLFSLMGHIFAETLPYNTPEKLAVETFQTEEDHNFIEGFREKKIPLLIRKALGTEHDFIVAWLRENTAELNDYQLTIKIMQRGVRVTEAQFGWLKKEVDICAEILGLNEVPHVFVVGDTSMTADVVNFHDPMILLSSDLIEKSNLIALRFAIGQQMGHILCDHVFLKLLFSGGFDSIQIILGKWVRSLIESFISKISNLILVDWTLAREISADRAGLIACQNLQVAQQAMINFKLAIDVNEVKINPEDYLKQAKIVQAKRNVVYQKLPDAARKSIERWERSNQLASDQPFMFLRFHALAEFAESERYQNLWKE